MAQVQITLDQVGETAGAALDDAVAAVVSSLQLAAGELEGRAQRLQAAAALLEQQQGAEPEEVAALKQAASQAAALQEEVATLAGREPTRPRIAPDRWLVFGRVSRPDGQPASGVFVRVTGALEGAPRATTDKLGDFSVAYRQLDFPEEPEQPPDVHVVVEDEDGQQLHESGGTVRFTAGQAEYVEITLDSRPQKQARRARKTSKPTAPKGTNRGRSGKGSSQRRR
jgi:hypothetical protein